MTNTPDLLPCPFCGGEACYDFFPGEGEHGVCCLGRECGASVEGFDSMETAFSAWNTRATPPQATGWQPVPDLEEFQSWWRASKYCQVVFPKQGWEQIALDGWNAALASRGLIRTAPDAPTIEPAKRTEGSDVYL